MKRFKTTKFTHKHHIIPKHAGGTDDPSNIVELTVEEHAQAHLELFEKHGRWQDKLAWRGLSGQIDSQELIRKAQSEAAKRRDKFGEKNPMYGKKHSGETKRKIGLKSSQRITTDETRKLMSKNRMGSGNSKERKARVMWNGVESTYECLKDFCEVCDIPYSTLKSLVQRNQYSKKWNVSAEYI